MEYLLQWGAMPFFTTGMIHRKSTFFLGLFIFFIPFLGLPTFWKTTLIILSGITLIGLSVKIILPKKILKHTLRHKIKKEKENSFSVENITENTNQSEIE